MRSPRTLSVAQTPVVPIPPCPTPSPKRKSSPPGRPPGGPQVPVPVVRRPARLRPVRPRAEVPVLRVRAEDRTRATRRRSPRRTYAEYMDREEAAGKAIPGRSSETRCPGCGAKVLLEDNVATEKCPFCATHLENKPEAVHAMIPPESLLPFRDGPAGRPRGVHDLARQPLVRPDRAEEDRHASANSPACTCRTGPTTR